MFEKLRIKEHMEVADSQGRHIGTVDEVDGDDIKLTKSDASDHQHHRIPVDAVDRIEDNRIVLKADAPLPQGLGQTAGAAAGGSSDTGFASGSELRSDPSDTAPFGTSGQGTGSGGSGAGN